MSVPIFSPYKWQNKHLTCSFVPDGTLTPGTGPSNLFALYNGTVSMNRLEMRGDPLLRSHRLVRSATPHAGYPQDQWQNEIKAAFAGFQKRCGVTFAWVDDDGTPMNNHGGPQGNPGFGDIRIAAGPQLMSLDLSGYPPDPNNNFSSWGIVLNGQGVMNIGSNPDLQSLIFHAVGINLGMLEGQPCGPDGEIGYCSVLNGVADYTTGPYRDLYSWDIQGMTALYGAGPEPPPVFTPPPTAAQFTNAVFLDPNGEYMHGARIQDAYVKMLGRMPGAGEASGWANTPTQNILDAFAQSAEFCVGVVDLSAWIVKVYQHGLNRTPSQGEINMWIDVLT
jgi:hypothetical protein